MWTITLLSIVVTISVYLVSRVVAKKFPSPFTTPVFFSTTIIIIFLLVMGFEYSEYELAKEIMTFLLGPATVALAVPLYKNRKVVVKNSVPAIIGLVFGVLSTIISAVILAKLLQLSEIIIASLSMKSVTVPIAVEISRIVGGDPALTAAFVVATGTIGTMFGPWVLSKAGITHPLSRGLSLGTISHGQGTAQAAIEGELQGAVAAVGMGLAAILTSMILPFLLPIFL
ncbi:MAG: LrgB family protein [Bacillaceae bacterium]|nr:LrgB family protein [Bacillaceae bacterium]